MFAVPPRGCQVFKPICYFQEQYDSKELLCGFPFMEGELSCDLKFYFGQKHCQGFLVLINLSDKCVEHRCDMEGDC